MKMRSAIVIAVSMAIFFSIEPPCRVHAGIVFQETFDSGSASYTTDPYWQLPNQYNNLIVRNLTFFGNSITHDVSGGGYFLFEGTGDIDVPSNQTRYYISPTFTVLPNTNYTISFYLTNMDAGSIPKIQPEVDGVLLGSPVSAIGTFATDGWQQFTFSWNSGSHTSGQLALNDSQLVSLTGNDFGTDDIVVTGSVPEPSSII